jgi:hypothetical protein
MTIKTTNSCLLQKPICYQSLLQNDAVSLGLSCAFANRPSILSRVATKIIGDWEW